MVDRRNEPRLEEELGVGRSMEIRDWIWVQRITVQSATDTWCYRQLEDPPMAFQAFPGWGPWVKRVVRARVESDGRVVLLTPDQAATAEAPEQPKGFPIAPSPCKI